MTPVERWLAFIPKLLKAENRVWVGRLGMEGKAFVRQMKSDDDKRRAMTGQLLFGGTTQGLDEGEQALC